LEGSALNNLNFSSDRNHELLFTHNYSSVHTDQRHRLTQAEKAQLMSNIAYYNGQAAYYSEAAEGLTNIIRKVKPVKKSVDIIMGVVSILDPRFKAYSAATHFIESADLLYRASNNTLSIKEASIGVGGMLIDLGFMMIPTGNSKLIELGVEPVYQTVKLGFEFLTDDNR
jgi:hypothetical protein